MRKQRRRSASRTISFNRSNSKLVPNICIYTMVIPLVLPVPSIDSVVQHTCKILLPMNLVDSRIVYTYITRLIYCNGNDFGESRNSRSTAIPHSTLSTRSTGQVGILNFPLRERLCTHKVFTKDQYFYLNYHKFSIKSYVLDVY